MLTLVSAVVGHLPSYGCENRCCHPPYDHEDSQVFYGRGNWGLELDIADFEPGEILDIDAVFRDAVDPSTFDLYIGCGGCLATDPILAPKVAITGYEPAVLEPFTHTRYYSIFPENMRTYDTSLLANCTSKHFTIRLIDHGRPDGSELVWGPVIGLREDETLAPLALLQYPIFVLRNHGPYWNEQGWTYYVILFVVAPLLVVAVWASLRTCYDLEVPRTSKKVAYTVVIVGFTAALLENLYHTVYAQVGIPVGGELSTALILNFLSNGLGILLCIAAWSSSDFNRKTMGLDECRYPDCCKACTRGCWKCSGNRWWIIGEFAAAAFFLFFFGAGFYIGPIGIFFAAIFRGQEDGLLPTCCKQDRRRYERVSDTPPERPATKRRARIEDSGPELEHQSKRDAALPLVIVKTTQ
jgi:hypothetical protein